MADLVELFLRKKISQGIHRERVKGRNSKPGTICIRRNFISQVEADKTCVSSREIVGAVTYILR